MKFIKTFETYNKIKSINTESVIDNAEVEDEKEENADWIINKKTLDAFVDLFKSLKKHSWL
jgi:hypothetical protein